LAKIGNDDSLPALVGHFRLFCRQQYKEDVTDTNQWALSLIREAIQKFYTERGLRAMLECAAWSRKQWHGLPEASFRPDSVKWVRQRLQVDKKEWAKALKALRRDRLPADQRKLLDEALKDL